MGEKIAELWSKFATVCDKYIFSVLKDITFVDVIDILLLSVILFYVYRFIKERRAAKLAIGILLLSIFLLLSIICNMRAIKYILQTFYQVGFLAVIIIFQTDLRAGLERVGNTPIKGFKSLSNADYVGIVDIAEKLSETAEGLSLTKTGALIIIERNTKLGEYLSQGVIINADLEPLMLRNIFYNKAPLHDGAVIIRDGRIYAAGCFLPLSLAEVAKDLGTRHRAALGLSEVSDAAVIVVSEETGIISLASAGTLERGFDRSSLKQRLIRELLPSEASQNGHGIIGRKKNQGARSQADEKKTSR
ncbi:MAG: diadenylate cyclase CdaA [Clostridia bacterium]|nr:diadenylate cyclase CdaA [Clostridia bacterium]